MCVVLLQKFFAAKDYFLYKSQDRERHRERRKEKVVKKRAQLVLFSCNRLNCQARKRKRERESSSKCDTDELPTGTSKSTGSFLSLLSFRVFGLFSWPSLSEGDVFLLDSLSLSLSLIVRSVQVTVS